VRVTAAGADNAISLTATIAFDRNGTLTADRSHATDIQPLAGTEAMLLLLAAGVETGSAHPLARAVLDAANARGLQPLAADDAEAMPSKAAVTPIARRRIVVGSPRHVAEQGIALSDLAGTTALDAGGKTIIVATVDNRATHRTDAAAVAASVEDGPW
jgi:Cd2+/Zn2+-exporting ATPase